MENSICCSRNPTHVGSFKFSSYCIFKNCMALISGLFCVFNKFTSLFWAGGGKGQRRAKNPGRPPQGAPSREPDTRSRAETTSGRPTQEPPRRPHDLPLNNVLKPSEEQSRTPGISTPRSRTERSRLCPSPSVRSPRRSRSQHVPALTGCVPARPTPRTRRKCSVRSSFRAG